jgi:hypothetical protein
VTGGLAEARDMELQSRRHDDLAHSTLMQ